MILFAQMFEVFLSSRDLLTSIVLWRSLSFGSLLVYVGGTEVGGLGEVSILMYSL